MGVYVPYHFYHFFTTWSHSWFSGLMVLMRIIHEVTATSQKIV